MIDISKYYRITENYEVEIAAPGMSKNNFKVLH